MDILKILGVFGIGTASIMTGIVYLFKQVFLHKMKKLEEDHRSELRKREENHKKELNKELKKIEAEFKVLTDRQIDNHKSELQKINDKYHITFSKLHAERAEIIRNLYKKLVQLQSSAQNLLGPIGILNRSIDRSIEPERMDGLVMNVATDMKELIDYYKYNRIYFSLEICEVFQKIMFDVPVITSYFLPYTYVDGVKKIEESTLSDEKIDSLVAEYILDELPRLQHSIEDEFRKLLGVIEEIQVKK